MSQGAAPRVCGFGRVEFALLLCAAVGLCTAVAIAQGYGENAFGNMGMVHFYESESLCAGRGFGRSYLDRFFPDLFTRPTYTILFAPFTALFGRDFAWFRPAVAATQGAMNAVTALAVAATLRRAGAARAARLAAWGIVVHPVLVSQAASLVDTALFTCLFCGSYAAVAALRDGVSNARRALAGAVLGLAILTRSTALTLAPALAASVRRTHATLRARLATAGIVAVVACAVLAPWLVRNHGLTGRWTLSTVDGVNLWMGNNENTAAFLDANRSLDELPGRERFDSSLILPVEDQIERCDAARDAAYGFMRANPGRAAVLAVRKAGDLWSPVVSPRTTRSSYREAKDVISVAWTVPLYLLALTGVVVAWRTGGATRAFAVDVVVVAACFTVPHALAWGGTRLRAPIDPLVVGVASIGAVAAWDRLRRRSG